MVSRIQSFFTAAAIGVCLTATLTAVPAHASLQSQMDTMFNSMSNVTNPTAVMGQRRGLIAGGRYSLRNGAVNVKVLSVLPPSAMAGCSGIDMFGGSFSFVSADQFVQLLRSIAANASGYAFKMALQAMCPSCDAVMSKLQSLIQRMNNLSVGSCQAGKMLVNAAVSATPEVVQEAVHGAAAPIATKIGAATDAISAMFPSVGNGNSAVSDVAKTSAGRQALEDKQVTGNIVWSALTESNAAGWWPGGDTSLMGAVMSVSGSLIVRAPKNDGNSISITPLPPILDIKDFMAGASTGNEVKVYKCLNDTCYDPNNTSGAVTNPATVTVSIQSFTDQVELMVLGIVSKFAENQPLNNDESKFMAAAPAAIGGLIRNLARMHPGMANLYAAQAAPTIAQLMATDLIFNMLRTAKMAIGSSASPHAAQVQKQILDVTDSMHAQAASIKSGLASLRGLIDTYNNLREAALKRRLGVAALVKDTKQ